MKFLTTILAILIFSIAGFSADFYASPNGSGTSCSLNAPCALQTALNLPSGSNVYARDGVYKGKFISKLVNGSLQSYPGEHAIIDGYLTTTLTSALTSSQTTVTVSNAAVFTPFLNSGAANSFVIGCESFFVNSTSGNTFNVNRAAAGSSCSASAHAVTEVVRLAGSQLQIPGSGSTYKNLEIRNSDPFRNWNTDGAEGLRGAGVIITGSGNKVINNVIHDNLNGVFTGSSSSNTEIYGNVIYNEGMYDGGTGKGHALYAENSAGVSKIYDNLMLNTFGDGAQMYGRTSPYVGGDWQGNAIAASGLPVGVGNRNLTVGPESVKIPSFKLKDNFFFHKHNVNAYNVMVGYGAGVTAGEVSGNYFVGGGAIGLEIVNTSSLTTTGNKFYTTNSNGINIQTVQAPFTVNNNTYYFTNANDTKFGNITQHQNMTFLQWKSATGYDVASTSVSTHMPNTAIVRPNMYEVGRANIIVFAQTGSTAINVDLSSSGLVNGQAYVIKNAFNYFGADAFSGTYNSSAPIISLPLTGNSASVATPAGGTSTPASLLPSFGAFVVIPGQPAAIEASISGKVVFGNKANGKVVPGVVVSASDVSYTTDDLGNYILTGFGSGSYTVSASKVGDVKTAISSLDAALTAQYAAGLITLTADQKIVADVSGDGVVTSFDAAMIAKYVSGQPYAPPGVGLTGTWKFVPASRTYPTVVGAITGQDYKAYLMGDVSGNW